MSLKQMEAAVRQAKLPEGQLTWWPRWLEKYARWTRQIDADRIEIREQSLIELLRSLRDSGKNAYTRLQLVRAVEFYQQQVLVADSPDLSFVRSKLEEIAAKENAAQNGNAGNSKAPTSGLSARVGSSTCRRRENRSPETGEKGLCASGHAANATTPGDAGILSNDDKMLLGRIDPSEPALLQEMRKLMRVRHYAPRTERSYVGWIVRFAGFVGGWSRVAEVGEVEVKEFLSDLAVNGRVAASTQNQAFNALLFVFRDLLHREMNFLDAERAKKPTRIPVVLNRNEVSATFQQLRGTPLLFAQLLYGQCRNCSVMPMSARP